MDGQAVIEVKATETVLAVHKTQVLTYLQLTNLRLELVINFRQRCFIDERERNADKWYGHIVDF